MEKPRINNQIKAPRVRVIDESGKNLGIFEISKALALAQEKNKDLIEVSSLADPPVVKIMDFGKFLYQKKRKTKSPEKSGKSLELKYTRIHLGTSVHDLETKAKKASNFLKNGHRLRIELFLKGREKYLKQEFLKSRIQRFLDLISENYKISEPFKKGPRGYYLTIEKDK